MTTRSLRYTMNSILVPVHVGRDRAEKLRERAFEEASGDQHHVCECESRGVTYHCAPEGRELTKVGGLMAYRFRVYRDSWAGDDLPPVEVISHDAESALDHARRTDTYSWFEGTET
jgi:hypothetical protein